MTTTDSLQLWQGRLTTVSRNLMDLAEQAATKRIRVRLPQYQGVTSARAKAAVEAIDGLWQDYLLLARVVEEADDLAKRSGIFHNTDAEIRDLLDGASVQLPSVHVPLPARDLLTAADRSDRVRPAEVLDAMQKGFVTARDTLAEIDQAESRLTPRIAALTHEAQVLGRWAATLGGAAPAEGDLSALASGLEADPLGAVAAADRVEAALGRERARLEALEREQGQIRTALADNRAALAELTELAQRSRAAIEEARSKLAHPAGLVEPVTAEALASLAAWLDTLEATLARGQASAVKVGLAKFHADCASRLEAERRNYARNRADLDERVELKGRFTALSAKAAALAERGLALGPTLRELAREADEALAAKPFDADSGRKLVAGYETALAAAIRQTQTGKQNG